MCQMEIRETATFSGGLEDEKLPYLNREVIQASAQDRSKELKTLVSRDNRALIEALNELTSTPTGAKLVTWLRSNGWKVEASPTLNAGGSIDFDRKVVEIGRSMMREPKEVLAGVVGHEIFHAMRYAQSGYNYANWVARYGRQEEFAGLLIHGKVTLEAEGRATTVDTALERAAHSLRYSSYREIVRNMYPNAPHNPADTSIADLQKLGLVPAGWAGALQQRYREVME